MWLFLCTSFSYINHWSLSQIPRRAFIFVTDYMVAFAAIDIHSPSRENALSLGDEFGVNFLVISYLDFGYPSGI